MERLDGISLQLRRELKSLEGDLNYQVRRLKQVELYMSNRLKKVRQLLKKIPSDMGIKSLPLIVDYLSEIQGLLGKFQDVNLDKDNQFIDYDVEINDVDEDYGYEKQVV